MKSLEIPFLTVGVLNRAVLEFLRIGHREAEDFELKLDG